MKKLTVKSIFVITILSVITSCKEFTTCKNIESSEITMLLDVSDEKLYETINQDFSKNLGYFMKETPFVNLSECEKATFSIAHLSAMEEFSKQSSTIAINQKGLSGAELKKRGNPSSVVKLIKRTLTEYKEMSKDTRFNSSTNLSQNIVKSVLEMDIESDNTIVIFSDGVINNKVEGVNFYKKVPENSTESMGKILDNDLKDKLSKKLEEGLEVKIVFVLKQEPKAKVNKRTVKAFWIEALKYLGFSDVQIIDNLSNKIEW